MTEMTPTDKLILDRFRGFVIPPTMHSFDMSITRDTHMKLSLCGQFYPGTADRLAKVFDIILAITREAEREDEPEPSPPSDKVE